MKRRFTILSAALALLVSLAIPMGVWGQTRTTQTAFYGFETGDAGWTATSFVTNNTAITAHGGSKYGATNGSSTANVKYDALVANPQSLTCYYSKTTTNTNAGSHFEIQVSSDNSTWTTVESGLGMNQVEKGTWYELTADLSSYSDVYVRVYYTGTSAVRTLDDITLTYDDGTAPSTDPEITFTPTSITLDEVMVGNEVSTTFSVAQANLASDITLSVDNGSLSTTSIAQGAEATNVTWTYTPTTAGAISATVTATSGTTTETLAISGTAIAPVEGYDVNFEYAIDMYPNWTFDNMTTYQTGSITAHGGTYYGTTGGKATASITTTSIVANPGTLTCYVSKQSGNTTSSTWYIQVSEDGSDWTDVESHSATSMSQGSWVEFTADLTDYTDVYVRVYYSGSTAIRNIDDLTLTTVEPSSAVATTTTINVPANFNNDIYQGTTAGTLTATVSAEGAPISGATVTWSSSNTDVATIDASTGVVTLVAVGTTTITASYAGVTDQYRPSSATYSLEVTDSTPLLEATFIFNTDEGLAELNITKPNAGVGTDLDANHDYVIGNVTMNVTHGGTNTRIWNNTSSGTTLRVYSGGSLTFFVPAGYAVTKVTFDGSANFNELSSSVWTASGEPVSTITFTNKSSGSTIRTITVEYEENASVVDAPTLPASVNFLSQMTVEITNNTSGATVYYTTDGTDPKTSNTRIEYTQAFTLNATTTVKAVALKNSNYSQVVEATYTLVDALDTMQAVFNAAGDETTNVFVNFNNYVVSGVSTNGKSVFVTDNNGNGFVIFNNNGGLGQTYSVGSILSGTAVPCNLVKYNGFAELLSVDASNLTITTGGTVSTSNIAMANLSGVNTGALVSYENLTCSVDDSGDTPKYYLSDGTTTLQVYNSLYAFNALENGKKYNITGIYQQYHDGKEILPRSAADIEQIFTLPIPAFNSQNGGYRLISSPVATATNPTNPGDVTNMLTQKDDDNNTYDLYRFDQAQDLEWRNYRNPDGGNFSLEVGKGYLYGNLSDVELVFTGTAITSGTQNVTLDYTEGAEFAGWNLVGNPFGVEAYIDRPFYRMNTSGQINGTTETGSIGVMEGVFVIANSNNKSMEFSTESKGKKGSTLALNLSSSHTVLDRAIVRFDEGQQLPKFQLNKNHTKVYFTMDGKDYAIVRSEEMGELPVNFKAEDNGTYNLNFSSEEVSFAYLHLIDNMTGTDIDLLQTPSYSFEAKTTDYESRFKLVFATGDNSNDDTFAFYSNGSFVINNEGNAELQVIDVTGRIVKSESVNGCANVNVNAAPGVYMLRLVNGDNVKVQKVVVK